MVACQSLVETDNASKYIQQLCKHFAHKVDVEYDAEKGFAALPPGPCTMKAQADGLFIHCEAGDEEGLKVSRSIIEDHLVKFAWREEISFAWEDGIEAA